MTPDEHKYQRRWDAMTYPTKLQYVTWLFDRAKPQDIVWHTHRAFDGWYKWRREWWYE